ncbi:antibiotic ABC transporter [Neotabrizicola sp. VNH66]|uniref:antibiotic ABC transporter n=1 Tax=Neotabrizicola sp. VNH66 TaxID=3400918 RepID=UPI003C0263C2
MFASPFFPSPAEMLSLGLRSTAMLSEAQMVISLRLMGFAGFWPVSSGEGMRMVTEKLEALHEAQMAALNTMARGGSAAAVAEAALKPVRRRTRANARRLSRAAD